MRLLLSGSIPENIASQDGITIDYKKLQELFVRNNVLSEREKFFYFLKKAKIEDDFLGLSILSEILQYINKNGFVKISILLNVKRNFQGSVFFYTIPVFVVFDLKDIANPNSWFLFQKQIVAKIQEALSSDEEKYEDEKIPNSKILRYKYGKKREEITSTKRNQNKNL